MDYGFWRRSMRRYVKELQIFRPYCRYNEIFQNERRKGKRNEMKFLIPLCLFAGVCECVCTIRINLLLK